jgi:SagB-type dehydrogenase family enzyme
MIKNKYISLSIIISFMVITPLITATEKTVIELPKPKIDESTPLMKILMERKSIRSYSYKELPLDVLSELLWAAFGINRPDSGKRTAPSAGNVQDISIYVALKDGVYLYDPTSHTLKLMLKKDLREKTGRQAFVKTAPLNLIFVSDFTKYPEDVVDSEKRFYAATNTGFISENVYLFCAKEGLGTVVREAFDREELHELLNLKSSQWITFCQTVGYPKDKKTK